MKFIHCSDLHLDSKMEQHLSAAQARERNAECCATFARLVRYAAEQNVTAVLIAGDMFDTERASAQTAGFVLDQIRNTPQVDFLYLRGNHDEAVFDGMELPENFKTFDTDWSYHRYEDVVIAGLELNGENWESMYDTLALQKEDTNIVMLHGQESTKPDREQIALPLLRGKNIDYLALGHIHSYRCEKLDLGSLWCYCGCLEGRGFDECGEKGFVLLEVEGGAVKPTFVSFARRMLREVAVDITGMTAVTEILQALEAASEGISSDSLVKFILTGSYTLETQKDPAFLKKMLEGRFYFLRIKDESRLKIEKETYEHDISLKGEFIRLVMASDKTEEEKEQIICCGIRALSGEEVEL